MITKETKNFKKDIKLNKNIISKDSRNSIHSFKN
jgi:hypothetical protein